MATKEEISIEEYKEILKTIDLDHICLIDASFKIEKNKFDGQVKLIIKESPKFEVKENHFIVIYKTSLKGINEENKETVLNVSAVHELTYKSSLESKIPHAFFNKFGTYSASMVIWPYFREYVQNMISRTQLPSLTLPLKKML